MNRGEVTKLPSGGTLTKGLPAEPYPERTQGEQLSDVRSTDQPSIADLEQRIAELTKDNGMLRFELSNLRAEMSRMVSIE